MFEINPKVCSMFAEIVNLMDDTEKAVCKEVLHGAAKVYTLPWLMPGEYNRRTNRCDGYSVIEMARKSTMLIMYAPRTLEWVSGWVDKLLYLDISARDTGWHWLDVALFDMLHDCISSFPLDGSIARSGWSFNMSTLMSDLCIVYVNTQCLVTLLERITLVAPNLGLTPALVTCRHFVDWFRACCPLIRR